MSNEIDKLFENLNNKTGGIDPGKLMGIMNSPEGKQLISLLNSDGGASLKKAAEAIQHGNAGGVKEALEPLMSSKESGELLDKIGGKLKE